MTNEEARKICNDYITNLLNKNQMHLTKEEMRQAMNISKEQAEAFGIVMRSFNKEIPKKVEINQWMDTTCPTGCGRVLSTEYGDGYYAITFKPERCPRCGQRLDWGDDEAEEE